MSFIKKFTADPKNLVGPDVIKAPRREINLSGTTLSFACPPQTASVPPFMGNSEYDINTAPEESGIKTNNASVPIYSSGWDFADRAFMGTAYGGVMLHIILLRNLMQRNRSSSLFNKEQFEKWVCDSNEMAYGSINKEMIEHPERYVEPIVPEKDFFQYPKLPEDIVWTSYNTIDWVRYDSFQPGDPADTVFETPITDQHIISVSWSPSAYQFDYFSPDSNLRAAVKAFIESIMATMKIELSADAQRQLEEARAY